MNKKIIVMIGIGTIISVAAVFYVFDSKWQFERSIKAVESSPTKLVDDFVSFQKQEEVTAYLKSLGQKWEIASDSKSPGDSFRPEFNEMTIRISNYRCLETLGTLDLVFNNNRLFQTVFYPSDIVLFFRNFKAKFNKDIQLGKKIKLDVNTSVESQEDYEGKIYIQWSDDRITNEVSEWIKRFS